MIEKGKPRSFELKEALSGIAGVDIAHFDPTQDPLLKRGHGHKVPGLADPEEFQCLWGEVMEQGKPCKNVSSFPVV